jgi:hypothetical protein
MTAATFLLTTVETCVFAQPARRARAIRRSQNREHAECRVLRTRSRLPRARRSVQVTRLRRLPRGRRRSRSRRCHSRHSTPRRRRPSCRPHRSRRRPDFLRAHRDHPSRHRRHSLLRRLLLRLRPCSSYRPRPLLRRYPCQCRSCSRRRIRPCRCYLPKRHCQRLR